VGRYPPQPVSVLGPAPTLSPSFLLAQAFSSQTFSRIHTPTFSNLTLGDFQLYAKILVYFYIKHLLKFSTCFEHYPAHLQEVYVVILYLQPPLSSLSAGDCPVHWLRKKISFTTGAQNNHLRRVTIPEAAYIQLRRRPPEDEQGNARNM
jgi:hypothetical protein